MDLGDVGVERLAGEDAPPRIQLDERLEMPDGKGFTDLAVFQGRRQRHEISPTVLRRHLLHGRPRVRIHALVVIAAFECSLQPIEILGERETRAKDSALSVGVVGFERFELEALFEGVAHSATSLTMML
jgi:hypothetical protein